MFCFFFLQIFPLGTIFPSLGASDPAVFTNVSPGTSQSNSITERLGEIKQDIRRNMMILDTMWKILWEKNRISCVIFTNDPSWNNPIQSNLESCISETTIIQLYLNVWYGIASLRGMAHYHMVVHGMVRYCMVLYGTVPLVQNGNNCMVIIALFPQQTSFNPMHQNFSQWWCHLFHIIVLCFFYRKIQECKIPPRYQFRFFRFFF